MHRIVPLNGQVVIAESVLETETGLSPEGYTLWPKDSGSSVGEGHGTEGFLPPHREFRLSMLRKNPSGRGYV